MGRARGVNATHGVLQVWQVLGFYVVLCSGVWAYLHQRAHGQYSIPQISLSFFLNLNVLICLWEIALGWYIGHIKKEYERLKATFHRNRLEACMRFFHTKVSLGDIFSGKFWSIVWSTYALYDPSYANKESFGFFVDVGNGWSTLLPSLIFCCGLTYDILPARILGMIGLVKFYQVCKYSLCCILCYIVISDCPSLLLLLTQEFYGTVIYFLSFFLNRRYKGEYAGRVSLNRHNNIVVYM